MDQVVFWSIIELSVPMSPYFDANDRYFGKHPILRHVVPQRHAGSADCCWWWALDIIVTFSVIEVTELS